MVASHPARGQASPDAGSLFRDIQRATPPLEKPPAPVQPAPPSEEAPIVKQGQTVVVKDFHIISTIFPEATLKEVVKQYIGRECTLGDLEEAAAQIARYYREHDRLAHAYLPKQAIRDGVVEIVVIEGKLGAVSVDPTASSRLNPDIAIGRILAHQEQGEAIRPSALQAGIASVNSLPGVNASAALVPGKGIGESDVVLQLRDTPLLTGDLLADNASARAVGSWRGVAQVALNNALTLGDLEQITFVKSSGSQFGRVGFSVPVTASGLTLAATASYLDFAVHKEFNAAEPSGNALSAGASASYPLLRRPDAVLDLSAGYEHRAITNQTADVTTSDNQLNVATLGVSGSHKDDFLGGGITSFGLGATVGNADLGGNAENQAIDQVTARTAGVYARFNATASRLQSIGRNLDLALSLAGQLAQKNLDSSEKFSLGGPSGVRAYPVNEGNGDDGWLATAELRYSPLEHLSVGPFFDLGGIVQHHNPWPGWQGSGNQPNIYELYGPGIFALWAPLPAISVKGSLARALGNNPGAAPGGYNADGQRNKLQFWTQVIIHF